jgi:hypothetical protein
MTLPTPTLTDGVCEWWRGTEDRWLLLVPAPRSVGWVAEVVRVVGGASPLDGCTVGVQSTSRRDRAEAWAAAAPWAGIEVPR